MNTPTQSITDDLVAEIEAGNIHGSEWAIAPIVNRIRQLEEAQRWIRVSDRLPKDGQEVIICVWAYNEPSNGKISTPSVYTLNNFFPYYDQDNTDRQEDAIEEGPLYWPTHWMPLPEPPR